MSLFKALLLTIEAIWFFIAVTSPNASPAEAEQLHFTALEPFIGLIISLCKIPPLLACACEVIVICFEALECIDCSNFLAQLIGESAPAGIPVVQRIHTSPLFLIGFLLAISGASLRMLCFHTLGHFFTFEVAITKDHKLVTTGPYAVVRHPSYVGGYAMLLGMLLCHISEGSLLIETGALRYWVIKAVFSGWMLGVGTLVLITIVRTKKEDEALSTEFKGSWEAWAARVKYRLIPGVY